MTRPPIKALTPKVRTADLRTVRPMQPQGKFADPRRGSRHERGYGTEWDKLRATILERDNYVCQCEECKAQSLIKPATHVDHRVPKARGGSDDPSNLRAMNKDCHKRKTAREHAGGV